MSTIDKYHDRAAAIESLLCIGLDSDVSQLPEHFRHEAEAQYIFNQWIIDQTYSHAVAYKINAAFYEARGEQGWREMKLTARYIRANHPDILLICDAKRGDNANSNSGYVTAIFDDLGFDAVTLHPYLGKEALQPFLNRADKASIILCRTSNTGAGEIQDLVMHGKPLWEVVAEKVSEEWNVAGNCMLVVGGTYPEDMRIIRKIVGDMPLLVPGIGVQGGDINEVVTNGLDSQAMGLIINSSRGIIFAEDPGLMSQMLQHQINQARYAATKLK